MAGPVHMLVPVEDHHSEHQELLRVVRPINNAMDHTLKGCQEPLSNRALGKIIMVLVVDSKLLVASLPVRIISNATIKMFTRVAMDVVPEDLIKLGISISEGSIRKVAVGGHCPQVRGQNRGSRDSLSRWDMSLLRLSCSWGHLRIVAGWCWTGAIGSGNSGWTRGWRC